MHIQKNKNSPREDIFRGFFYPFLFTCSVRVKHSGCCARSCKHTSCPHSWGRRQSNWDREVTKWCRKAPGGSGLGLSAQCPVFPALLQQPGWWMTLAVAALSRGPVLEEGSRPESRFWDVLEDWVFTASLFHTWSRLAPSTFRRPHALVAMEGPEVRPS